MKYSQLITLTEEIIRTYNENIMTPDSHAESFFETQKKTIHIEDTERVFIKQVFYGCQRYRQFLRAFNNVFFSLYSAQTNRNDSVLYNIFVYIICFRLDELPFAQFKKIVLSQNPVKMNVLFDLLFDMKKLRQQVRPEWSKCLDESYVDEKIIDTLERKLEAMAELIGTVCEKATGKKSDLVMSIESTIGIEQATYSKKDNKRPATVAEPFNLTKPKGKVIPEPEKIEVGIKAKPAPNFKKDLKSIEEEKNKRRQEIQQNIKKYYQENQKEPTLEAVKRPTNIGKVKEQVEKQHKKTFKPDARYSRPMPVYNEVETKLNVAAILREEKKLKEKIEEEQKKLRELELNMRDEKEFENWQRDMKEKDKYQELENQQRKKIEMELAREAAIKAYQEKIEKNKIEVQQMKEIAVQLRQEREELEYVELEQKKKLVEEVNEKKENIVVEREKVVEKNKKIAEEEKVERKRINDKKKEELELEMQKKKELIREIRELEKQPKAQARNFIATETMGYGLLEEMSMAELRERLTQAQEARKKQEEQRRQENLKKKSEFNKAINDKKEMIMNHRAEQARIKEEERLRKKKEIESERQRIEEAKLKSANEFRQREAEKQAAKKLEQDKLNKELKEISQKRQFMNENQAAVEANAFKNQELGAQREMLNRQNERLINREKVESIKHKETKIIADQAKREIQSKINFNRQYDEQREEGNRINMMMELEDKEDKATKYNSIKDFEFKHTQSMNQKNDYKTKISEMNLTRAKQSLAKKK